MKKLYIFGGISLLLALGLLSTCSLNTAVRSGSIQDAFVEEPLPDENKEALSHYLVLSNNYTSQLIKGDFANFYTNLDDRLKAKVSLNDFEKIYQKVLQSYGRPQEFKSMQWAFTKKSSLFSSRLTSTKIVLHERGLVEYRFDFNPSDSSEKLLGFFFGQFNTVYVSLKP